MLRHPSFCGLFLVCSGQYLSKLVLNGAVVNQQQRHRWSEAKSEGQCSHIQQMSYYSSNCWKSSCWFLVKGVRMHSLFDMALHSCRRDRVPMLTSVHHWKHQQFASEHQKWTGCMSITYLENTQRQDALWIEGKPAKAVWCFGQSPTGKLWVLPHLPTYRTSRV